MRLLGFIVALGIFVGDGAARAEAIADALVGTTILACAAADGGGVFAYTTLPDGTVRGLGNMESARFVANGSSLVAVTDQAVLVLNDTKLNVIQDGAVSEASCHEINVLVLSIMKGISAGAARVMIEDSTGTKAERSAAEDLEFKRRESTLQFKEGQLELREKALDAREHELQAREAQ